MNRSLAGRQTLIVATLLIFVFGIVGIPKSWSPRGLAQAMFDRIHLGLDLRGGTQFILKVHVNDAVNATTDRGIERLKEFLAEKKTSYNDIGKPDPVGRADEILIKGLAPEAGSEFRAFASDRMPEYDVASGRQDSWTLTLKPQAITELNDRTVQQEIAIIRNRVDKLGITEPHIQQHGLGKYQILVELPGIDDPARVKKVMESTAMLEIRQALNSGQPYPSEQAALQAAGGVLPANSVLLHGPDFRNREESPAHDVVYLVSRTPMVAGNDLREARVIQNPETNGPEVEFFLTTDGGHHFSEFTGEHIGDYIAVVLDNQVRSVAVIHAQIGDHGVIEGRFDEQQANDLALVLNSGALPAGITYFQESVVGPSLGNDSIHAGVRAAVIGMAAVLVFMPAYYRGAGVNADVALILNLIILLGFMGYFGATLTLPGIAGVILTVGMGVDSNVLIFERIREEVRNGKAAASAVAQGFRHAWMTIIDTHVTTIISAAILFLFGTGPIKGFAVTLTFGLLANLFTAVFVSRAIFDWLLTHKERGKALSI